MLPPLLTDIVILFALGMAVVYLCQRLKVPTIVGFLLTGVLAGPHGLAIIAHAHDVELLAEVGVVLLLFTIGLEFSFGELLRIKRPMFLGGALQVFLSLGAVAGVALVLGRSWQSSVFLGCVLSLSSTAIVLKLLQERAAMDSPQGRTSLAILIFQDLIVVAMLLATPLLGGAVGGEGGMSASGGWQALAKGGAVLLALALAARWGAPWLLRQVADTRSRELFIVTIVVLCMAVAWLTGWAGLSLALGAFLAGLIISDSPYSHQAIGHILPLRDLFTSLFFVSIGMLLDLRFLAANPLAVALGLVGVLALKSLAAGLAALALRLPARVAVPTGLSLAQVGEFSFILAQAGAPLGLLDPWTHQLVLVVSVLTMGLTPPLMALGARLSARLSPAASPAGEAGPASEPAAGHALSGHLLVVGYGLGGRNVARAARLTGLDHLVLEMNPLTVRDEQAKGAPIVFGDAVNPAVLEHAGAPRARALVVTIPDPVATRRIVANAKAVNPGLVVIARTRFQAELPALKALGADEVVSEEFESAVAIFARLLRSLMLPQSEVERLSAALRAGDYQQLRIDQEPRPAAICDLRDILPQLEIITLRVQPGSPAAGRDLAELELRQRHGLTVLAIRRGEAVDGNPPAQSRLQPGDWLVVLADPQRLAEARGLFRSLDALDPDLPDPA